MQTHRTLQSVRATFGVRPVGVRTHFGNNRGRYGAVVSGAKISITSQATSRVLTLPSGGGGEFAVDALMPGRHKVEVQAANIKTATQDVTLEVGQVLPPPQLLITGQLTSIKEAGGRCGSRVIWGSFANDPTFHSAMIVFERHPVIAIV